MKKLASITLTITAAAWAQQPKFEMADVHPSKTAQGFVQNFGGVLRGGRYVNRDATLLDLIEAAYSVSEDNISGGPSATRCARSTCCAGVLKRRMTP